MRHLQASFTRSIAERGGHWLSTTLLAVACFAAIAALYADTIIGAIDVWGGSEAHRVSFLILPVALYFVWVRRDDLFRLEPQPDIRFALLALPTGFIWLLAELAQVNVLAHFAVVVLFQIVVVALIGPRTVRVILFPVLFLWLLVPFGESFIPFLVKVTTTVSVQVLNLSGLVTQADGNLFTSGEGDYTILGDCASLDFLLGNAVIALVFANLMYLGMARRTCYVLATFCAAFLANIFRIVSVVLITEYSGGAIDLAVDHALYGKLIFLITIVLEMKIGLRFRDAGTQAGRAVGADLIVNASEAARPISPMACLLVLAIGIVAPPLYTNTVDQPAQTRPAISLAMPSWLESRQQVGSAGSWVPRYAGSDAELHAQSSAGGQSVDWYVAYYWRQGPDSEMIAWRNDVFDAANWYYLDRRSRSPGVGVGPRHVIETRLHDDNDGRRRVWHWYWIAGRFVADPVQAKLLQATTRLVGLDGPAAVVAISMVESGNGTSTTAAMEEAMQRAPDLERLLSEVHH